jgi:hypothetical protein
MERRAGKKKKYFISPLPKSVFFRFSERRMKKKYVGNISSLMLFDDPGAI